MTVGISSADADAILNLYRATNITAPTTLYVKLHTGDPGAAGTANASAVTTRNAVTFSAPASQAIALSSLGTYAMTTTETITHLSIWDNSTAGTFRRSVALTAGVSVVNGSTLQITTLTISVTPIAA